MSSNSSRPNRGRRRGAVTVEFAVIAPLFLLLVLGGVEIMRIIDAKMVMESAIRDGARLSTMDRAQVLRPGQSMNAKIEGDIRRFLTASGVNGDAVLVSIVHASDNSTPINLDDPDNAGVDFRINLETPYTAVSRVVLPLGFQVHSHIVYRNSQLY